MEQLVQVLLFGVLVLLMFTVVPRLAKRFYHSRAERQLGRLRGGTTAELTLPVHLHGDAAFHPSRPTRGRITVGHSRVHWEPFFPGSSVELDSYEVIDFDEDDLGADLSPRATLLLRGPDGRIWLTGEARTVAAIHEALAPVLGRRTGGLRSVLDPDDSTTDRLIESEDESPAPPAPIPRTLSQLLPAVAERAQREAWDAAEERRTRWWTVVGERLRHDVDTVGFVGIVLVLSVAMLEGGRWFVPAVGVAVVLVGAGTVWIVRQRLLPYLRGSAPGEQRIRVRYLRRRDAVAGDSLVLFDRLGDPEPRFELPIRGTFGPQTPLTGELRLTARTPRLADGQWVHPVIDGRRWYAEQPLSSIEPDFLEEYCAWLVAPDETPALPGLHEPSLPGITRQLSDAAVLARLKGLAGRRLGTTGFSLTLLGTSNHQADLELTLGGRRVRVWVALPSSGRPMPWLLGKHQGSDEWVSDLVDWVDEECATNELGDALARMSVDGVVRVRVEGYGLRLASPDEHARQARSVGPAGYGWDGGSSSRRRRHALEAALDEAEASLARTRPLSSSARPSWHHTSPDGVSVNVSVAEVEDLGDGVDVRLVATTPRRRGDDTAWRRVHLGSS